MTTWKELPDWPYDVSDTGQVRRRGGAVLSASVNSKGYLVVRLSDKARRTMARVHRLVASAFIVNEACRPEVNHLDGCKTNNRVENLEWATPKENRTHAWRTGLRSHAHLPINHGANNGAALLSDAIVLRARLEHRNGGSFHGLARKYGVDRSTYRGAHRGETWAHVPIPAPPEAL